MPSTGSDRQTTQTAMRFVSILSQVDDHVFISHDGKSNDASLKGRYMLLQREHDGCRRSVHWDVRVCLPWCCLSAIWAVAALKTAAQKKKEKKAKQLQKFKEDTEKEKQGGAYAKSKEDEKEAVEEDTPDVEDEGEGEDSKKGKKQKTKKENEEEEAKEQQVADQDDPGVHGRDPGQAKGEEGQDQVG